MYISPANVQTRPPDVRSCSSCCSARATCPLRALYFCVTPPDACSCSRCRSARATCPTRARYFCVTHGSNYTQSKHAPCTINAVAPIQNRLTNQTFPTNSIRFPNYGQHSNFADTIKITEKLFWVNVVHKEFNHRIIAVCITERMSDHFFISHKHLNQRINPLKSSVDLIYLECSVR